MNKKAPIGIFDSGVGGTSIWKEIHALMPRENCLYLADSAHAPYGNKTAERIIALSEKNTRYLIDAGAKIIVVACNTATTNAIAYLRQKYPAIPFIGIEPAIKPAALNTHTGTIGILATKGTLNSALFHETAQGYTTGVELVEVIGEGLVRLIEDGKLNDPQTTSLLKKYLAPMVKAKVDYIVLGCSHYPYLIPTIQKLIPKEITLIDSGAAVARQTQAVLKEMGLLNPGPDAPNLDFLTNGSASTLSNLLEDVSQPLRVREVDF